MARTSFHGILVNMFRNGNAAHQILVKDDFLPGEDVLEFLAPGSGGFRAMRISSSSVG